MALMMDQAADGVWLVTGTDNNWVLVADGDEVTLVDAGFPRDLPRVLSSLERIGRTPGDVAAIVLTHAHPDHIGASERLRADCGVPVRLLDAEVVLPGHGPRVLAWVLRIARAGGARVERLTQVDPFAAGSGPLDVPGRLVPVPTPGHTSGHCAYHLPARGVLIAGDALMTAHPAGRTTGPQLLPRMFNHDEAAALASLRALAGLSAEVVLPGHGPAWRGTPASAVEQAVAAHR